MKTTTPASIELVPVDRGGRTEYVWQDGARFVPGSVQYTRDDVVRENAQRGYFPELRRLRKKAAVLLQGSRKAIRDRNQAIAERDEFRASERELLEDLKVAVKERDEFRQTLEDTVKKGEV